MQLYNTKTRKKEELVPVHPAGTVFTPADPMYNYYLLATLAVQRVDTLRLP